MDLKDIIDTLNNSPRFGRPEAAKTVVITDALAKDIVKALNQTKVTYKGRHAGRVQGAAPL